MAQIKLGMDPLNVEMGESGESGASHYRNQALNVEVGG